MFIVEEVKVHTDIFPFEVCVDVLVLFCITHLILELSENVLYYISFDRVQIKKNITEAQYLKQMFYCIIDR